MTRLNRQNGMTLIELMIAIAIFMIITAAIFSLYLNSNRSYNEDEIFSRMQENGRFALKRIARDLYLAGFWGEMVDPEQINDTTGFTWNTNDCDMILDVPRYLGPPFGGGNPTVNIPAIRYYNDTITADSNALEAATCTSTMGTIKDGTNAIAIKRVSGTPTTVATSDGKAYLRTNGYQGNLIEATGVALPTDYQDWLYMPTFYFIKDHSTQDIPYLCQSRLDIYNANPADNNPESLETIGPAEQDCFAEGVQQLHIEFGIDTDDPGDGIADQYTSTPTLTLSTSPTVLSTNAADQAITARIYLLMRSARQVPNYTNTKTYDLGTLPTLGPFNDSYYRRVFSTTVTLRNPRTLVLFDY